MKNFGVRIQQELKSLMLQATQHQNICPKCQQPILVLKHTIICGCGSKIKNKFKFKLSKVTEKSSILRTFQYFGDEHLPSKVFKAFPLQCCFIL